MASGGTAVDRMVREASWVVTFTLGPEWQGTAYQALLWAKHCPGRTHVPRPEARAEPGRWRDKQGHRGTGASVRRKWLKFRLER